jgi:signal transduction histidine kinase/CheY-like chemotaxis protein
MKDLPFPLKVYIISVSANALTVLYLSTQVQLLRVTDAQLLLLFLVLTLITELFPVSYGSGHAQTVSTAVLISLAFTVPPLFVCIIALTGAVIPGLVHKKPWYKTVFNTAFAVTLYGTVALLVSSTGIKNLFLLDGYTLTSLFFIFCLYVILSTSLLAIVIALANGQKITSMWRESLKFFNAYDIALLPYGLVLAWLWQLNIWHWHFFVGLLPLVALQRSFADHAGLLKEQRRTAELVEQQRRVHEAMTVLLSGKTIHEQLHTLLQHIQAVFPVSRAGVVLWGAYAQPDAFVTRDDAALELTLRGWRDQLHGLSAARHMVRLDQACPTCSVDNLPLWLVPLVTPDGALGSMVLVEDGTWELSPQEQRLVETFASQAALAINQSQLIERLKETRKQLLESERLAAIGGLAAGVAHEFNNLLSVVSGNVQVAMDEPDEHERQILLDTVVQLALNGTSITEGLLRFGRREEPKREETNLPSLVDAVLTALKNDCKHAKVTLVREFDAVQPVVCEPGAISQVLINLLYNALDAIHPNAGTLTVRIKQQGPYVAIAVQDTGCGIAPDILHTIFEPFMTTKTDRRNKLHGGTGLGLSVSHGIVANHGGYIDVESEHGKGSTFTVYLPITPPLATTTDVPVPAPLGVPHLRVVVVDDEPAIAQALGRMLSRDGHTAAWFTEPEAALAAISDSPVDVVFADLRMPGMDGLALLDWVKQQEPSIERVLISAHIDPQNRQQAYEHGVNTIIEKPFNFGDIRRALGELASGLA